MCFRKNSKFSCFRFVPFSLLPRHELCCQPSGWSGNSYSRCALQASCYPAEAGSIAAECDDIARKWIFLRSLNRFKATSCSTRAACADQGCVRSGAPVLPTGCQLYRETERTGQRYGFFSFAQISFVSCSDTASTSRTHTLTTEARL